MHSLHDTFINLALYGLGLSSRAHGVAGAGSQHGSVAVCSRTAWPVPSRSNLMRPQRTPAAKTSH